MLRIRIFRALLPVLLIFLGLVIWRSWNPRTPVHRDAPAGQREQPRAEGLLFKEYSEGSTNSLRGHADVFEPREDGTLHLEGIRELEIQREDRGPLIISAMLGDRRGPEGEQRWSFKDQVVFRESEQDLQLSLPFLDIDEQAGEARSSGDIRFEATNVQGRAKSMFYGLNGQPGELLELELVDGQGGRVRADRAVLLDGIRDVELIDNVRVTRQSDWLEAGKIRMLRGPQDRLRQAIASDGVAAKWSIEGVPGELQTERLDARWDDSGEIEFLGLSGRAFLVRGENTMEAGTLEAVRQPESGEWKIDARDHVYVQGRVGLAPGSLRAAVLQGSLDASMVLQDAQATGDVIFEGQETRAEADRATFTAGPLGGQILMFADGLRKARLARARIRVAARQIRTDIRGIRLEAEGLVESTLLPATDDRNSASGMSLFTPERAIHFVSDRLESVDSGAQLTLDGSVRGWQGERNLAAETIIVDQVAQTLEATGGVTTRFPRGTGAAAAESDYLQIAARELSYDDRTGRAVYTGEVRVRLFEGWLEAEMVEIILDRETRAIKEIRAVDRVHIEFHRTSEGKLERPLSGTADRLLYSPEQATIWLYGDQTPPAVRRMGDGGGTTTGRVLSYGLDSGNLEVDSGEQGLGRIRS